ncbi:PKD domain-containing protein [Luteolibacter marinus]|uniref:PKD domain-containing protein n=1 Tax=Luteolibacter marinus TaxID=2776705 RepID=UPI00186947A1
MVTRNAPHLNQGTVHGSVRVMQGSNFTLNSGLTVDGSLILPGHPEIKTNGGSNLPFVTDGGGSQQPDRYRLTLNNGVQLGGITLGTDAEALPEAPVPVPGSGNRTVHVNHPDDEVGEAGSIRSLTINHGESVIALDPGRYDRITLNGSSTLELQGGSEAEPAIYEVQQLTVNGGSRISVHGPVVLRLKNSLNLNGYMGDPDHPEWLELSISGGSFNLNGGSAYHGRAVIPSGSIIVNSGSLLHGLAFTDRLTLNGDGVIDCEPSGAAPNQAPIANGSEVTTPVGAPIEVPLQASDPEDQPLVYQIISPPQHGTLSTAGPMVTYTPDLGFSGTDIFYFKVSDGLAESEAAAVLIHVFQPNRPPVADDLVVVLNQGEIDTPLTLSAVDPDGDPVTYEILASPTQGVLNGDLAALTYSHTGERAKDVVADAFTYRALDPDGLASESATVTLLLQPVNRAPHADAAGVTVMEDGEIAISLSGTDPDGDLLQVEIVPDPEDPAGIPGPRYGSLSGDLPDLTYRPAPDFNGVDVFHYTVSDGAFTSAPAKVTITVLAVNDPPTATSLDLVVEEEGSLDFSLSADDPDGDPLAFEVNLPDDFPGQLSGEAPTLRFSPDTDFNGVAAFTFSVLDSSGSSASGQVRITVTPVNDPPTVVSADGLTQEDESIPITLAASDPDGDVLEYTLSLPGDFPGQLEGDAPELIFHPAANYHGTAYFEFTAIDPDGLESTAAVNLTVTPVNDIPVAAAARGTTHQGEPVTIPLTAQDIDGDPLTFALHDTPVGGTVVINGSTAIYQPEPAFSGIGRFNFTANDGAATSAPAEIVVEVDGDPVIQILSPLPGAVFKNGEPIEVVIEASDPEGRLAAIELAVDGVRVTGGADGRFVHDLGELEPGDHTIIASAIDTNGRTTLTAPVQITVTAENQAPVVFAGSDRTFSSGAPGPNLLVNGGNEEPLDGDLIPGWTSDDGSVWGQGVPQSRLRLGSYGVQTPLYPAADEGTYFFHVVSNTQAELWQDVALDSMSEVIATGSARLTFEALARTFQRTELLYSDYTGHPSAYFPTGELDRPSAAVEFWNDTTGEMLSRHLIDRAPVHDQWGKLAGSMTVPIGATRARVWLIATLLDPSTTDSQEKNDAMFDAVSLRFIAPGEDFLNGTVTDDGQPSDESITVNWTQISGPPAEIGDNSRPTTPVRLAVPGAYEFQLEASDGEKSSADTVAVTLLPGSTNQIPSLDAGDDLQVEYSSSPIPLSAMLVDDSPDITLEWSQLSGPGRVSLSDPFAAETKVSVPGPGTYVLHLKAYDGEWTVEDRLTLVVTTRTERPPLDLAIVIDHSGSMWALKSESDPSTPIYKARQAARRLISTLDPAKDRVAVRRMRGEFLPITSDLNLAAEKLVQPQGEPGTYGSFQPSNIDKGIQGALDHLLANPRETPADRAIVLFGDGAGPYADIAAREAREAGVRVVVIAFSNGIDPIDSVNMELQATVPADFLAAQSLPQTEVLLASLQRTLSLDVNRPPVVNAGNGMWLPDLNEQLILRGSYQDDGLPWDSQSSVRWEQVAGSGIATISDDSILTPRVTFDTAGEYRLKLTVSDGESSSSDIVTVRVAVPCEFPGPAGLTAWWPFDGNLRDAAGDHHLTRYGYWESPRFTEGPIRDAVQILDGGDILDGGLTGDLGLNSEAGFSIEFRMRARGDRASYIFAFVDPATGFPGKALTWGSPNLNPSYTARHLYLQSPPASTPTSTYGSARITESSQPLALDVWHHVVVTHDRGNNQTWAYIDGVGRKIFTSPIGPYFETDDQFSIGGLIPTVKGLNTYVTNDPLRRFDGDLDDLAFYSRPLSDNEVLRLFESAPHGKCPPTLNQAPVVDAGSPVRSDDLSAPVELDGFVSDDSSNLQIQWSMLSGPGAVTFGNPQAARTSATFGSPGIYTLQLEAFDGDATGRDTVQVHVGLETTLPAFTGLVSWISGNHHTDDLTANRQGVWSGTEAYAPVEVGDGFQFGDGNSYVRFLPPAQTSVSSTGGFTIEAWLQVPTSTTGTYNSTILALENIQGTRVQRVELTRVGSDPVIFWSLTNQAGGSTYGFYSNRYPSTAALPLDQPVHVALTWDPTDTKARIYLNGVLNKEQLLSNNPAAHFDKELFIGGYPGDARIFPGRIDELSFYQRTLTPAEILAIAEAGAAGKFPAASAGDPRVDAGADATLAPGESHTFTPQILLGDFDAASVNYSWSIVSGPGGVAFDNAALVQATATFPEAGRYFLQLTVSDGTLTVSDTLRVEVVAPVNQAPALSLPASLSLQIPQGSIDLDPSASDDGLPTGILNGRWVQLGGPATVSFAAQQGFATRATFPAAGSYSILFEASDGQLTTTREIDVTVLPEPSPNQAPVISAGDDQAAADAIFDLTGSATDDGKPGVQALAYRWNLASGPGPVDFADATSANTSASVSRSGTYRLRLSVSDGELSGSDELTIVVPDSAPALPNRAPTVALPAGRSIQQPASTATFVATVSDDGRTSGPLSFTWQQIDGPATATIATAAEASTLISANTAGSYLFELVVSDGELSTSARTSLVVMPPGNVAPVLSMSPAAPARPLETVTLSATASDDGLPANSLTYEWIQLSGPEIAFIADPLALETEVTFGSGGSYLFQLTASDGALSTRATVAWNVIGVPDIRIVSPDNGTQVTDRSLLNLQARAVIDGGRITAVRFEEGGTPIGSATRSSGTNDWLLKLPPLAIGTHSVTAVAISSDGQTATSPPLSFEIVDFEEQALTLDIVSPFEGDAITAPTPIIGSAYSTRLEAWSLSVTPLVAEEEPLPAPTWIAGGNHAVLDDELGIFDPTLLQNGTYQLTLSGTTTAGTAASYSIPVRVEGNMKIGHFSLAFEDLSIPLTGIPLSVTRTYDSRDPRGGDFGPAWNVGLKSIRIRKAGRIGYGWEQDQTISAIVPVYTVSPTTRKRVMISFPDGRTETFEPVFRARTPVSENHPNVQKFAEISEGTLEFKAVDGSSGTLEIVGDSSVIWNGPIPGRGTVIDITFNPADPGRFRYTEPEGTSYVIDEKLGLLSISEPNGNSLTINSQGVFHSNGENILFTRDPAGRITAVTDPAGEQILYGYDTHGRLHTVTDRVGEVTTYLYENAGFPHYLTSILDPRGIPAIRSEYDEDGRLISQMDAAGQTIEFEHDLADNREIIRDRLGHTTVHEYDDHGNVVRTTDALGGITRYSYDDHDNEVTVTTPLGLTTSRSYDARDNLLTETDPAGHVTRYTYDSDKRPLTISDALGQTTTLGYSYPGNLTAMADPAGTTTRFSYDAAGNLRTLTDAIGTTTTSTHDAKGNERSTVVTDSDGNLLRSESHDYDANGNRLSTTLHTGTGDLVTSFEYDEENRITLTTYPDGSTSGTVYNAIGKTWKTIDAAGRETVMSYDERGNQVRTDFPDGTFTTSTYDVEGRMTATTDAAGITTYTLHDALGRSIATILPDETMPASVLSEVADIASAPELADNPRSTTTYDADGRVTATTDALGNTTSFEYDAAGRRTAVIDALGHRTEFSFDAAGRQAATTDALGHTTGFTYDTAGRLTRTTLHDGTFSSTTYDPLGRRISTTDPAGEITRFEYDPQGRLVAVIDAEGGRTEYEYDSRGLQTVQRDALGRVTTYAYDGLGRRTARDLPGGQHETYDYDLLGRLTGRTDFNGRTTTYDYDPLNDRLLATVADPAHPSLALAHAPARFDFEYDSLGRRTAAMVKNASGTILHQDAWSYDLHSRLLVQASTTGTLRYAWNPSGTLAGVKSDTVDGYDLSFDYDELDRLATVHQGQEGVDPASYPIAGYGYDAVGNLVGTSYINQVTHGYTYDSLNRLTDLAVNRAGTGGFSTPLQAYGYTLNAAGHRTAIAELGGRTISHTYDNLYRLTGETIAGSTLLPTGQVLYTYDKVGNRLTRSSSGGLSALLPSQAHAFNANDQLDHHSYDANGNTTLSDVGTDNPTGPASANDVYSFDNRLIRRTRSDGKIIDLLYNGDGDRVSKWVQQGGLNESIHRYLVDRQNHTGYAQVVEESDGSGNLVARHLYGHDLIAFDSWIDRSNGVPILRSIPERRWYHYDGLGSVRALSNDDGVVTEAYTYDAYGSLIAHQLLDPASGEFVLQDLASFSLLTENRYLFTGEQWDPDLRMYFLRARYLNPSTGRFQTQDAYEGRSGEPLTLHKYLYVHANPVAFTDPTGHMTLSELGASIRIQLRNAWTQVQRAQPIIRASYRVLVNLLVILNIEATLAAAVENRDLPMILALFRATPYNLRLLRNFNKRTAANPATLAGVTGLISLGSKAAKAAALNVPLKINGLADFHAYRADKLRSVVFIELTGSRREDQKRANRVRAKFSLLALAAPQSQGGGKTWHHHEVVGIMELVKTSIHQSLGHDGGAKFWSVLKNTPYRP